VNGDIIALIYKPIACHSYNKIEVSGKQVLVATIDTMLSFYLAFLYADKAYFDKDRMLCMASYLFEVEQKNGLEQKGLLRRFSLDCYGKQPTLEEMRSTKAKKYQELQGSSKPADKKEFDMLFLKYEPAKDMDRGKKKIRPIVFTERAKRHQSNTPTKTREIETAKSHDYGQHNNEYKKTRRHRRPGKHKKNPIHKHSVEPYAKRNFYFGRR
jgi:hypothetical protein